jgi:predicted AAA+ superfamily ATPase
LVLHEIRSHVHYTGVKGSLGYWATPTGSEIDFVWWYGRKIVAIEVKHGSNYRREYRKGIEAFGPRTDVRSYVVYLGQREMLVDGTRVLPLESFLRRLHAGEILG